jgi:RNA polymerase sigma factor (sigma-70 family)
MNVEWQAILSDASAMDDASDQELGHKLEAVVRQHARLVYQVAYLLLRNHHDAEDAPQETFLRVWRYRKRLPEARDLKAWLARIAWRVALDRRKNAAEIETAAPLDKATTIGVYDDAVGKRHYELRVTVTKAK